ncbi:nucleotidyltransferase domain-containing protein [Methanocaldococcus indicus]|uniref:nucleotidyltransferase domain-containing protein n=1 Tax=Methanocaldococcus indicus TaxID=213231 RepID=UPI003C6D4737
MNEEKAIKEFVNALKSKYKGRIKKIILFGSYARGDYTEESDIDILIVGDVDFDYVIDLCTKLLLKYGVVINAIIESEEQFNKKINWSFHRNVLKEGKILY